MLTKLFNELGAETLKEKIVIIAEFIGMAIGCYISFKLFQTFLWVCYCAGIPM